MEEVTGSAAPRHPERSERPAPLVPARRALSGILLTPGLAGSFASICFAVRPLTG